MQILGIVKKVAGAALAIDGGFRLANKGISSFRSTSGQDGADRVAALAEGITANPTDAMEAAAGAALLGVNMKKTVGM